MGTTRMGTIIGLTLGAVWAIAGFAGAALAAALAGLGYLVGAVIEGRIDVIDYLSRRRGR
ncbi:MAG: DUF2273 domain-containing protein [Acidimicrobiales bacterium]